MLVSVVMPCLNEHETLGICIQKAKDNLEKIDTIGILEKMDMFVEQIKNKLGFQLRIGHENKSPSQSPNYNSKISDEDLERIKVLCQPDEEIYQHALALCQK